MCKIRNEEGEIEQRNVVQQSGVFYDLLPKGGEIDLDTVEVFADNTVLRDSLYDIETINNYQDSGRTLLIIKIKTLHRRSYKNRRCRGLCYLQGHLNGINAL